MYLYLQNATNISTLFQETDWLKGYIKIKKFLLSPCQFVVSSYAYPFLWNSIHLNASRGRNSPGEITPLLRIPSTTYICFEWLVCTWTYFALRVFKQLCFASLTSFGSSSRTETIFYSSCNATLLIMHLWMFGPSLTNSVIFINEKKGRDKRQESICWSLPDCLSFPPLAAGLCLVLFCLGPLSILSLNVCSGENHAFRTCSEST